MNNGDFIAVVKKFGTPLYLYDKRAIERRIEQIIAIPYPRTKIFAATMANASETLLALYRSHGLGAFVNSIKHLELCRKVGFRGAEIMWTSTGMNERQMRAAIKEGVMLNLDSVSQLELYGRLNPGGGVGLRINIGDMPDNETYAGVFVGCKSRIGLFEEEIGEALAVAVRHDIRITGLHVYLGTQIRDVNHFSAGARRLFEVLGKFRELEYVDLGGGFAVPEDGSGEFNFELYNREMSALMTAASEKYGRELMLILEPGRVLAGDAGYFITRVTDLKLREDSKFVFVEGSSAIFTWPLFYPDLSNHPHFVLGKETHHKLSGVDICGSTTYSRDFLARDSNEIPEDITIGDIIVFKNAGSYSYYSKTDFLGIETPPQVLYEGNAFTLITPGERFGSV